MVIVTPLEFFNEILQGFMIWVEMLFSLYIFDGFSVGSLLVAIAVITLLVRIIVMRLRYG